MALHVSHCIPSDGLTIATLETATMTRCSQIELGSATPKAMRDHLAQYYPLLLEHDVPVYLKDVCLKVVGDEGMIAFAAWELPHVGEAGPAHSINGVPGHEHGVCDFAKSRRDEDAQPCAEGEEGLR